MIHITDLYKTYDTPHGRFEALKGINLRVEKGEIFGIIGPSGAGKSTLVQCMNLLERPDRGTIDVGGEALTGLPEARLRQQRRRIGMIFQHFNLLTRRTVYGNVALPLEVAGVPRADIPARVNALLKLVGLDHLHDRYPSQISGGQKQRVGIARALANDPDVLLSDEATSALDPETTHTILSLLRDINRKTGITIVMITHQMEVVREICDRVAVLSHGEVAETGSTLDVFSSPKSDVARGMVSAATSTALTELTRQALTKRMRDIEAKTPGMAARLWRLSLVGDSDSQALLVQLGRDFDVQASLVQARIEDIQGAAVGTLFVLAQGAATELDRAAAALQSRNITVKDLSDESADH